jgi:hypothetical protein
VKCCKENECCSNEKMLMLETTKKSYSDEEMLMLETIEKG